MNHPRSPMASQLPRFSAYGPRFGAYASADTLSALRRFKSGLGATTETGVLVSKGVSLGVGAGASALIGTAAGTAGAAVLGAAAGSVVPIVGTIIGAAVGFLTQKLFGTADYAQVYSDVSNNMQLFEAYEGVAGQYPGRVYGWPEIHYVFYGAMFYGMFPGNGTSWGTCTQASITHNINACGTSAWLDDWIGAGAPKPGSGSNNIVNLVGTAISHGVTDPRLIASQYLVPGAEAVALGKNNSWISVKNSRDPALYTQMLVDIADVIVSTAYPNTPVYYGGIPGGSSSVAQPSATVNTPSASQAAITAAQNAAIAYNTGQVPTPANAPAPSASTYSPSGSSIKAGSAGVLITAQGTWSFVSNGATSAGYPVLLNGGGTGGAGVLLSIGANGSLTLTDASNNTYSWNGSGWTTLTTATAASSTSASATAAAASTAASNPASQTPTYSPAGSVLTPASGGSLISPAGTWTFGGSNDGNGNYQILLNGSAASAGNSNATQLQINSSGTVVATVSNGATYGWSSGGWNTLSGPITSVAVSTPSTISANGATIIPGGGSQLITAQGEWTFSTSNDGAGNYYLMLNGSLAGSETGIQLTILNGVPTLLRTDGSTWGWSGTGWVQQTAANLANSTTLDTVSNLLNPPAPVDDSSSYDGGPYADGLGSSSYSAGYTDTSAPAPVSVAATPTMSTLEKVLLYGGGALLLLSIGLAATRHHGAR